MKTKKVPNRKCVACQEMKAKKELIRVVRTSEGQFLFDPTGKQAGRGAYICSTEACLLLAQKNKGLERSFKMKLDNSIYTQLLEELKRMGTTKQ